MATGICTQNFAEIGSAVPGYARGQTETQTTDRLIAILHSRTGAE